MDIWSFEMHANELQSWKQVQTTMAQTFYENEKSTHVASSAIAIFVR